MLFWLMSNYYTKKPLTGNRKIFEPVFFSAFICACTGVYRAFSARFKTGRLFLNIRKKPKSFGWQLSTVR